MHYLELTSKRLRFFPWDETLTKAWEPFFSHPQATEWLGLEKTLNSQQAAKAWIDEQLGLYQKREFGHLALFDWEEEKLIGSAGILIRNLKGERYYEISVSILPNYWGKGYAGEACKVLIKYANQKLEEPKLISIIHEENLASQQVAKKIGFQEIAKGELEGFPVQIYGDPKLILQGELL